MRRTSRSWGVSLRWPGRSYFLAFSAAAAVVLVDLPFVVVAFLLVEVFLLVEAFLLAAAFLGAAFLLAAALLLVEAAALGAAFWAGFFAVALP